jgi:putative nucleotidyltransferase with HDIG domain
MRRSAIFLRSRVGRRIVFLFISCALLPVTVLAVISIYQVSFQLREQNRRQLSRASKQRGMEIYQRLSMLDSDLQIFSMLVGERRSRHAGQVLRAGFRGLALFASNGSPRAYWGALISAVDPPNASEQKHLASGNSLLRVENCKQAPGTCIFLVRQAQAAGSDEMLVVGELDPQYLWAPKTSTPDMRVCVLSGSRSPLFCSEESMYGSIAAMPAFRSGAGSFQWQGGDALYDAAYWNLLLRPSFLVKSWTVVVSQPHDEAIAPVVRFRRDFVLVVLLPLWIVLFFSLVQIRRTLGPLTRLQEGTRKIGAGFFGNRVEVKSGDEFEELADSFNTMAGQLGRQFHALKTIHEIDQAISASLDRQGIVDGVLGHMPKLIPCVCFAVCVFDESRSGGWMRFRNGATGEVLTVNTAVSDQDWRRLQAEPQGFAIRGDENLPEYLHPLSAMGMQSFLVLPIRFENSIQGALVCAQIQTGRLTMEETHAARQVADELAVALSHAHLIEALEQLHWGTLTALARAIDAKSKWTAGHSERVTTVALEIARRMGLSAKDLRILQMGGLLHDIGKIGTPQEILDKPGKLTADEMSTMKQHVRTGVRILEPVAGFREALPIVAEHHEWFDGGGYPAGVSGQDISLYARILAVADCYDALTSDRPYRKGVPIATTVAMLREKSGRQFDPEAVEVFTRLMMEKGEYALPLAASQSH